MSFTIIFYYPVDPAGISSLSLKINPCMSKTRLQCLQTAHYNEDKFLLHYTWITLLIVKLIHDMRLRSSTSILSCILRNKIGCLEFSLQEKSLIYQLQTVMSWITVALTDNGELGFGSGESA